MDLNNIIESLWREVDEKKRVAEKDPQYSSTIANQHNSSLAEVANLYSWWLEHPDVRKRIFLEGKTKAQRVKELKKISKEGKSRAESVWQYLANRKSIRESFSPALILDVGRIIDPNNYGFRNHTVTLNLNYTPPNPAKVYDRVEECTEKVRYMKNPVEAAITIHLLLTGIQPFRDGNKRTARILQNRWLYEHSYPPVTIHPSERQIYIKLLESALIGYRDDDLKMIGSFYSFMGSKINRHLEEALSGTDI